MDMLLIAKRFKDAIERDQASIAEAQEAIEQYKEYIQENREHIQKVEELIALFNQSIETQNEEIRLLTENLATNQQRLDNITKYCLEPEQREELEEEEDPQLSWYRKNNPGMKIGRI